MKRLSIGTAFIVFLLGASGFVVYEDGAQHRKPAEPAQPAPPQKPDEGHRAPADTPKNGEAVPRPPETRREPDRPRQGPRGGPVVVPYPGWPWWGYPYPHRFPPADWRVYAEWETANVRLDVSPKDAQVYVDRYYAGVIDDFDGIFQHLTLRAGVHLIEIRRTGYVTLAIEFNLYPWQSVTYRRTMEPSHGDEVSSAPPSAGFEEGAAPPAPANGNAPPGDVKFDVAPDDAAIYADGFYAGIVDDFNGSQHLPLPPGRHHLSLQLDGYETTEVDLTIDPGRTITYRASLKKLNP